MRRLLALALVLATGCTGLGNLPGGKGGGGYTVEAVFEDVLDLVPQAAVKVDDVDVGSVEKIELDGYRARLTLRIERDVKLPANAEAEVRQTSLLGEKFVELGPPEGEAAAGTLTEGTVIPVSRTRRNPEVEEVFSALAALLNGGGLPELQTIAVELSRALAGRETEVRSALHRVTALVGALDARKAEIVRAIDALDRLTASFAAQKKVIADALDEIAPALTVLADQRADLTKLLVKLDRLGDAGTRVIRESRDDVLADLALLRPILAELVSVRTELGRTVDNLVTFTKVVPRAIPGDYLQLYVELYVTPETLPFSRPVDPAPGVASLLAAVTR